jgi:hypothetical protein
MYCMTKEEILLSSGLFEIDSEGCVWRIAKRHGRGVKPGGGYFKGAKISPCKRVRAEYKMWAGYLLVTATIEGMRVVAGAHRLVWTSVNGPIPLVLTINHRDGVKANNNIKNLELATYQEQRRHALDVLNVPRHRPMGSLHPKTHLMEADVIEMRRLRASGVMVKDIAEKFAMSKKATSAICVRRTWQHV